MPRETGRTPPLSARADPLAVRAHPSRSAACTHGTRLGILVRNDSRLWHPRLHAADSSHFVPGLPLETRHRPYQGLAGGCRCHTATLSEVGVPRLIPVLKQAPAPARATWPRLCSNRHPLVTRRAVLRSAGTPHDFAPRRKRAKQGKEGTGGEGKREGKGRKGNRAVSCPKYWQLALKPSSGAFDAKKRHTSHACVRARPAAASAGALTSRSCEPLPRRPCPAPARGPPGSAAVRTHELRVSESGTFRLKISPLPASSGRKRPR